MNSLFFSMAALGVKSLSGLLGMVKLLMQGVFPTSGHFGVEWRKKKLWTFLNKLTILLGVEYLEL